MTQSASNDDSGGARHLLAVLLFASIPLAIGGGLLYVRHSALRETEAAKQWIETPCAIEKNSFSRSRDGKRTLELVYRYDVGGATYRGDRIDLLMGSMGDDKKWENRIFERYPTGSNAVCYVDPADPENSVFDRENAATKTRNLWLLAFPFLATGCGFALAIAKIFAAAFATPAHADNSAEPEWQNIPAPPPRSVSLLKRAVVLSGPPGTQIVWLFVVGFTFVFVILDGPRQYANLIWPPQRDAVATGEVTDLRTLKAHELSVSLYEYDIGYEVDGRPYTITSVTRGLKYRRGESVEVTYPSSEPSKGVLAEARESEFSWWHGAIPLGIVALLAFGLMGMYANNLGVAWLLSRGEVAEARWIKHPVAGAIDPAEDSTKTGHEVPTAKTNYQFEVDGFTYTANSFGPAPNSPNSARTPVLYSRHRPKRNVLLSGYLENVVRGQTSIAQAFLHCAPAPLGAFAIWLLFNVN